MNEIAQGGSLPLHMTLILLIMASVVAVWLIFR
jgi:hypothetical protein